MRFICGSYSADLSTKHSVDRRNLMLSPWYQSRWKDVWGFAADQDRKTQYQNTALGEMLATSVGGTITGFGGNILIFDDWINPKQAESEAHRTAAHLSYDVNGRTRLNDPKRDAIIVVEQRTHADDQTAHVLKQEPWVKLDLPALFSERRLYSFPISKATKVCEVGEVLQPDRAPLEVLEATRRATGTRTFNAQHLQKPNDDQGGIFNTSWWRFYDEPPGELAKTLSFIGQSWDMAFVKSEDSSFVVGLVGGFRGPNKYLLGEDRDQRNYPETKAHVRQLSAAWPKAYYKWVENKANGPAIVADLSNADDGIPGLIAVPPAVGDKTARAVASSACIESGNFFLPNPYLRNAAGFRPERYDAGWTLINPFYQWVVDFIEELAHFPRKPNDRGDALSQLIVMLDGVPRDLLPGQGIPPPEVGNIFDQRFDENVGMIDLAGIFDV